MPEKKGLRLINIAGIMVKGTLVTPEMLEQHYRALNGNILMPGISTSGLHRKDEMLFRELCLTCMQFTLSADKPTWLQADFMRFPYTIDGKAGFEKFACRLMPVSGQITKMESHHQNSLALCAQSITPEGVAMMLGNAVRLEVYFEPRDRASLAPLQPPDGFEENVVLNSDPA